MVAAGDEIARATVELFPPPLKITPSAVVPFTAVSEPVAKLQWELKPRLGTIDPETAGGVGGFLGVELVSGHFHTASNDRNDPATIIDVSHSTYVEIHWLDHFDHLWLV
jgi:hypothetical protein